MDASPLLTDLYQLAMLAAYRRYGFEGTAVFELSVRTLPKRRGFLMAAGLEQALEYLEELRFSHDDLAYLRGSGRFPDDFIDALAGLRFTGDVDAMPEGTIFFESEPILRITAPMPQAQFVETRLVNLLHLQTVIASKAARMVLAAPRKLLVDFGLRRAHGAEAGLFAARAAYITGFSGTATVQAGQCFGIPLYGTMAHSFVEAHDREIDAFEQFAIARPEGLVLLIDTYDTERAAHEVVRLSKRLGARGIRIRGVRIDSGDLIAESKRVRAILDAGGLRDTTIFASGGLDEDDLLRFAREDAPIDGFGMGTSLTTSSDVPALDVAYKLQVYDGIPRRKLSPGKASWPGAKQVWRRFDDRGRMTGDLVAIDGDAREGLPLLVSIMRAGTRVAAPATLAQIREHARASLEQLPPALAALRTQVYPVEIDVALRELAATCDLRLANAQTNA